MDKMREEFEDWAKSEGYYVDTIDDYLTAEMDGLKVGCYRSYESRVSWDAWKASRASLCVELPNESSVWWYQDVCESLDESGVAYKQNKPLS